MPATGRREAEKALLELVGSLTAADMSVSFGMERMGIRVGNGASMRMAILYIAVARGSVPMLALVRE
jgi:hypothetical protein